MKQTIINGIELEEVIKAKSILEKFGFSEFYQFRKITIVDWYVSCKGANGDTIEVVVATLDEDIRYATDQDFDNAHQKATPALELV